MFQPDQIATIPQFSSFQIFLIIGGWIVTILVAAIGGGWFWNWISGKTKAETTEIAHRTDQAMVNQVDERVDKWRDMVMEVTDQMREFKLHRAAQGIIIMHCLDRLERGQAIIEADQQTPLSEKYLKETREFIEKTRASLEEDEKEEKS